MYMYDVHNCRPEIVRPGMNLSAWVNWNKDKKPFAVCNASLYTSSSSPIGTIVEDGKYVHNDGNGYGYGIAEGKFGFGNPWAKKWTEYITGYNSPIQNGKYVEPNFRDDYVFKSLNTRIGIGLRNGRLTIVTDDAVTLKQFADHALALGFTELVNLDGGGSRHLYYDGKVIYKSFRVPYNALVFYKDANLDKVCEFCTDDGRCMKWK